MNRKAKKNNNEKPRGVINQFIIECMFSKYFEEEKEKKIVRGQEAAPTGHTVAIR